MIRTRPLPLLLAAVCAAVGGWLLDVASPQLQVWLAAFPAIALIVASLWRQRLWRGALLGALAGASFWLPHLSWLTLYLGPVPWLALCAVMILWFAGQGAGIAAVTRQWAQRVSDPESRLARHPAAAAIAVTVGVTGVWILREQLQGAWPYGGFSWGRVALTQDLSPFAQAVSWIGITGLSAAMVSTVTLVLAGFALPAPVRQFRVRPVFVTAGLALASVLLWALVPAAATGKHTTHRVTVAGVQGNAKAGIFDDRESGDVIRSHIRATKAYLKRVAAHRAPRADVLVWPENSAEFEVRHDRERFREVAQLSERANAPIVVGSVLADRSGSRDRFYNSALVMYPDWQIRNRYDKHYPVPFAEYMPNRPFFRALVPDLVDLVQLDYQPGTRSPVTTVEGVRTGLAVCFDITFDRHARSLIDNRAQIVYALTNNADFGRTDESAQQLAITRLQAIAMGRSLVNISTVGTSEILGPDGRTLDAIPSHKPGVVVASVPLETGITPAMRWGHVIAGGWIAAGLVSLTLVTIGGFAARRGAPRAAR